MIKRMALGAVAGAVATVPQSLVIWGAKAAGFYRAKPHPEQVAEQMSMPLINLRRVPEDVRTPIITAEHFAFGAASGAVYGVSTGIIRPMPATGLVMGLAVWGISYGGWIPALRIAPLPQDDESGRAVTTLVAHAAYGLALGALLERLLGKG